MTCPDCERYKKSAAMWRNKAYEASGHPLLWKPDELWQGLTVEEIWSCNAAPAGHHVECHICAAHQNVLDFAEAIAAKLKDKNT